MISTEHQGYPLLQVVLLKNRYQIFFECVLHFSNVTELSGDGSTANGAMVSLGGVLGRVNTEGGLYLSASMGYSYVDISDSGKEPDPTVDYSCGDWNFFCTSPPSVRKGGHAKGLGYRVAVGLPIAQSRARFELAYMSLGGQANALPKGAKGSMNT